MKKTLVRNISGGPRGAYLKGELVTVNPGKTAEADDFAEEWFVPVGGEPEGFSSVGDLTVAELVDLAIKEGVIDDVGRFKVELTKAIEAKRVADIMGVSEGEDASGTFDHDGNGEDGGSKPNDPPALSGKNKADLLAIAEAENVAIEAGATNDDIKTAIELAREEATKS